MGCWNETCVLTRTPIHAGDPVVAFTVVHGPKHYRTSGGTSGVALLFGLPQDGRYDDYGGVESLENEALATLMSQAFARTGLYRLSSTRRPHGGREERWLASSPDTLWGHAHHLKHLFYARHGVEPGDEDAYDARRERTVEAFKSCEAALKAVGTALGALELPEDQAAATAAVFGVVREHFGAEQAWAAFQALGTSGLYARPGVMLAHRAAYRAVVEEFGARLVRQSDTGPQPLRDVLTGMLHASIGHYDDERAKWERLLCDVPAEAHDALTRGDSPDKLVLRFLKSSRAFPYLAPLSGMWTCTEIPLLGHFWDAAQPREVLAAAGEAPLVDFLVFQWAQAYLRIELTCPRSGSQNSETQLPRVMHEATFKMFEDTGRLRRDFDARIF